MTKTPKLRFPGFTDAWEQRKLGEVGFAKSGTGFPDAEQGGMEGIPFFKVSDMNIKGNENNLVVANNYVTDEQIRRKKWNVIDDVPAIFFAKVGAAVMLNRKRLVRLPFLLDNNTMAYIFDKSLWDCDFGKTIFETINLTKLTQVGALPSYNASDVEAIKIYLPQREEQSAIGTFFRQLDELLTLHQRKLDEVKNLKKSLLQKMFPKNGERIPEVRFPEFIDAWEQRKLGEVADFSIKTNSLSRDKLSEDFHEVQNIHYGDILTRFDNILDLGQVTLPSIIDSKISNYSKILLKNGDVIFADAAEDSTVGKAIEIRNLRGRNVVSGLHTIVARPMVIFAPYYMGYYLNSSIYHNQILPLMQGTKVSSISKSNLQSTTVNYPLSIAEQTKIGTFFRQLDELLTLHQRKLEHLQSLKKALLQQMFV